MWEFQCILFHSLNTLRRDTLSRKCVYPKKSKFCCLFCCFWFVCLFDQPFASRIAILPDMELRWSIVGNGSTEKWWIPDRPIWTGQVSLAWQTSHSADTQQCKWAESVMSCKHCISTFYLYIRGVIHRWRGAKKHKQFTWNRSSFTAVTNGVFLSRLSVSANLEQSASSFHETSLILGLFLNSALPFAVAKQYLADNAATEEGQKTHTAARCLAVIPD